MGGWEGGRGGDLEGNFPSVAKLPKNNPTARMTARLKTIKAVIVSYHGRLGGREGRGP